eukprot:1158311-Pelagomonas_calceolata.AAC.5
MQPPHSLPMICMYPDALMRAIACSKRTSNTYSNARAHINTCAHTHLHPGVREIVHSGHEGGYDACVCLFLDGRPQIGAHLAQRLAGTPPHLHMHADPYPILVSI